MGKCCCAPEINAVAQLVRQQQAAKNQAVPMQIQQQAIPNTAESTVRPALETISKQLAQLLSKTETPSPNALIERQLEAIINALIAQKDKHNQIQRDLNDIFDLVARPQIDISGLATRQNAKDIVQAIAWLNRDILHQFRYSAEAINRYVIAILAAIAAALAAILAAIVFLRVTLFAQLAAQALAQTLALAKVSLAISVSTIRILAAIRRLRFPTGKEVSAEVKIELKPEFQYIQQEITQVQVNIGIGKDCKFKPQPPQPLQPPHTSPLPPLPLPIELKNRTILVPVFGGCQQQESGATTPIKNMKAINLLEGVAEPVQLEFERLYELEKRKCEEQKNESIAAVPEWWQLRPEAHRPQLIIQFAKQLPNGSYDSPKYPLTIPHYAGEPSPQESPIEPYTKGNVEAILILKDNSKVIVNAQTKEIALNVIQQCRGIIEESQLEGSILKVGTREGQNFQEIFVVARSAKFFQVGAANMQPNWSVVFA